MTFLKKSLAAGAAAAMLAAAPVMADEFTAAQKAELDGLIRAYILDNPEVIVDAMRVLEQRQQLAQRNADAELIARFSSRLFDDGFSHVGGNPDGDVTLVEFLDYRCGYCKQAHDGVKALIATDGNIRLVVKEFPILGPESTYAARAALSAQSQGHALYEAFNDAMMRHQGNLDQRTVIRLAEGVGLDSDELQAEMESPVIAERIRTTYGLAREMGISGTPAFVIGDEIVRGYVPYDTLRELVEAAREQG
ncbi:MAG: DsbA family protein [Pikeienuella sp.]